jgi:hypothetical protein
LLEASFSLACSQLGYCTRTYQNNDFLDTTKGRGRLHVYALKEIVVRRLYIRDLANQQPLGVDTAESRSEHDITSGHRGVDADELQNKTSIDGATDDTLDYSAEVRPLPISDRPEA